MKRNKLKKHLAMLLCAASILGQTSPALAYNNSFRQRSIQAVQESVAKENPGVATDSVSDGTVSGSDVIVSDNSLQLQGSNIAKGKSVTASAADAAFPVTNVNDGSLATRWARETNAPHHVTVNLGGTAKIYGFKIASELPATDIGVGSKATQKIGEFKLEGSNDGQDFETIFESPDNSVVGYNHEFTVSLNSTVTYKHIKLTIEKLKTDAYKSVSLREFEIWGEMTEVDKPVTEKGVNLAYGKNAVANSSEDNNLIANKALDGDTSTKPSRWASAERSGPHWIYVDLGKECEVDNVRIYWETRKATDYEIQVYKGSGELNQDSSWKTIADFNDRPKSIIDVIKFPQTEITRYVRVLINSFTADDPDSDGNWNTVSMYELEVYSGDIPATPLFPEDPNGITIDEIQAEDTHLKLNFPEGTEETFTYNGTDYEQLVDDNLKIYRPIVDTVATVSVKITNGDDYRFAELPVLIPGRYAVSANDNPAPNVLPELREWKGGQGTYTIKNNTKVVYKEEVFKPAAEALANDYKILTGTEILVEQGNEAPEDGIFFEQVSGNGLFKEGYVMNIGSKVVIQAEEYTGAYWATRTLLQSIKTDGHINQGITRDYPLYEIRSFVLDVGRKTFTMDYLKQVVKEMSWYKMNDFHVHLNDNYIFLENYTNSGRDPLTAYSGFRLESDIKKGGNGGKNQADLTNTDVFYTKNEFRSFIKESRNYGVNIVPEIDVPAHSLAFTKVRPDLRHGTSRRDNDHFALNEKYDECVEFIHSVFDEYMGEELTDPVFDTDTVVHVGCDEYGAGPAAFRNFSNDMIDYVQEKDRTVRMWGSLTSIRADVDVKSQDVQMNLWDPGYAAMDEMYELGFDLINTNSWDGYYIVPNAGYYGDYLDRNNMYNKPINTYNNVTIPAGDDQMLGGAFAVWNDMVDDHDNGVSEYDVYDRIKLPMALFGAKLWGKHDLPLNDAVSLSRELGSAPGNNFGYEVEAQDGIIAHYNMNDTGSTITSENVNIIEEDYKTVLELKGGESWFKTDFTTIGLGNDLRVKVKRTSSDNNEQILFESPYGSIKAVQKETGAVGFSREGYDYSFNYTLPVNEWVELEFKNVEYYAGEDMRNMRNRFELYVNGVLTDVVGEGGADEVRPGTQGPRPLLATMMLPVEYIGSKTNSFIGYVDDIRIGTAKIFNSTMELDYSMMLANEILDAENQDVKAALDVAKEVIEKYNPTSEEINNAKATLDTLIDAASFEQADYSRVNAYLRIIPESLSLFTDESVTILERVVASIRTGLAATMQDTVDGYEEALVNAFEQLQLKSEGNANYLDWNGVRVTASSYEGNNENAAEAPGKAIDNNPDTFWHTDWDITNLPHWISFEFPTEQSIEGLTYLPRQTGGQNGMVKKFKVAISNDGNDWSNVIATGNWAVNTNEKVIKFTEKVTTKYIRLIIEESHNNNGSAAEIYLHNGAVAADIEGLNSYVEQADSINTDIFTQATSEVLKNKLQEAEAFLDMEDADPERVEQAKRDLAQAMVNLRLKDGVIIPEESNKSQLQALVTANENKANDNYTIESWNAFTKALGAAKEVLGKEYVSQEEVDAAKEALEKAIEGLTKKDSEEPGTPSDNDPDSPSDNDPSISDNDPTISDNDAREGLWVEGVQEEYEYTGKAIKPEVFVYEDGKLLIEKKDYTLVHKNNTNAYTQDDQGSKAPYVEIKMKGNNTGSKKVYYKIMPVDISEEAGNVQLNADKLSAISKKNGKEVKLTPVLHWNGKKLKLNKDFQMTEGPKFGVGEKIVKLQGINNFTGEIEAKVIVSNGTVSGNAAVLMSKVSVKGYDKKPVWKEGGVTQTGFTVEYKKVALQAEEAGKVAEYTVSYGLNEAVGTAYIILTGTGEDGNGDGQVFIGTKTIAYKINGTAMTKKNITISGLKEMTYTGDLIYPEVTLNGTAPMEENVHYTATYTKNVEKGTASVTFTGIESAGYTGSLKATFKIVPAPVDNYEVTVSGSDFTNGKWQVPYTKGTTTPEWVVTTENGDVLEAGKDYTVSYKNNKKIDADATATIKGKGNYGGTQSVSFKILKKELSNENGIQVVVKDKVETGKAGGWKQNVKVLDSNGKVLGAKDYDKKNIIFAKVVDINDSTKDVILEKTDSVVAGDIIRVTVKGAGDYAGENTVATGIFRILKKGYDISKAVIKIDPQEFTGKEIKITDAKQFVNDKITMKVNGAVVELVLGKDIEAVENSYVKNVEKGTAKVTLRGLNDFGGSKTVTFKINARDISDDKYWN